MPPSPLPPPPTTFVCIYGRDPPMDDKFNIAGPKKRWEKNILLEKKKWDILFEKKKWDILFEKKKRDILFEEKKEQNITRSKVIRAAH
jgi:hypothetical protein